ncbi:hypothetical protein [Culicoidibacter larvae]|uniref:Oxaloacetate decarboxylase n=1 Tax=Culicoidibacter larvae TaxID=2579976 RepID=A0A5R8QHF1_9FIRM|nr:hypothetical protein [Culicoidibacter larvae]TLG77110.1 hypothetical protein FEZ08_00395 [Culicoidibacter larvae]
MKKLFVVLTIVCLSFTLAFTGAKPVQAATGLGTAPLVSAVDNSNRDKPMPLINYVIIGGCVVGGISGIIILIATIRYFKHSK